MNSIPVCLFFLLEAVNRRLHLPAKYHKVAQKPFNEGVGVKFTSLRTNKLPQMRSELKSNVS